MSVEAYTVAYEKNNYHEAIPVGYDPEVIKSQREQAIKENLISYAGEYRLGVKFDEYYYKQEQDPTTGESYLSSNEPGPVREVYRKAIRTREENGLSVRREVAECLGFEKFEKEILTAPNGTMAIWVSPPGKTEEGYGGYSFTFIGQKERDSVRMIPYRNINTLDGHSKYLSSLTGIDVNFETDIEALSSPFMINPREGLEKPEDILEFIGEQEKFDIEWKKELEEKSMPFIQAILRLVKDNAPDEEIIKVKNAFENFAIAYREDKSIESIEMTQDRDFRIGDGYVLQSQIDKWGYTPPTVGGSCGPSIEQSGAKTPMQYQESFGILTKDKYGERTFNCPDCNKENVRPYNKLLAKCQHCESANVAC